MIVAFLLCVALVVLAPFATIWDGPIAQGVILIIAAAMTAAAVIDAKPGQFRFVISTISFAGIAAVLPVLWMVIQVLPLKALGWNNPIWESAAAVLGDRTVGSISIDRGATLISLARYVGFLGIAFATATIAIERVRANQLCVALSVTACLIGLAGIVDPLAGHVLSRLNTSEAVLDTLLNCAVPGALLCTAMLLQSPRKLEGSVRGAPSSAWADGAFLIAMAGSLLCLAALLLNRSMVLGVITLVGIAVIVMVNGLRRFGSGPPEIAAIVSIILLAIVAGGALKPEIRSIGPSLAFAMRVPPQALDVSRRMASDAGWAGSGAGTFAYALPVHRDVHAIDVSSVPPTAAAMIGIEMGEPFLWVIMLAVAAVVLQLLRGAVKRGRDWIYPSAAATCLTAAALLSFTNAAMVNSAFFIILAVAAGMGLAQSKSRSSGRDS